jgi:hypothetical protein
MRFTPLRSISARLCCSAVVVATLAPAAARAGQLTQSAVNHPVSAVKQMPPDANYTPPRTPDGQPDIQGKWVNFDETPFEASGPGRRLTEVNPPEHWADHGSPVSARRRSMVVDPPDGLVPILPAAIELRDYNFAHVNDHWTHETPWVRCITRGVPGGMFPAQYNNGYSIHQSPGYVVIVYEMVHDARVIPLDGRPHLGKGLTQWNGDPRGRWEGNTLVIETTNYNGKAMIGTSAASGRARGVATSEALHIVERITPLDKDTLKYEVTITDPRNFARPWSVMMPLNRDEEYLLLEYGCHEGNYAIPNELKAGRAAERERK